MTPKPRGVRQEGLTQVVPLGLGVLVNVLLRETAEEDTVLRAGCPGFLPKQLPPDQPAAPGIEPSTSTRGPQTPTSHPQTGPAGMRQTTVAGGPPGSGPLGSRGRTCHSARLRGSSEETLKTVRPEGVNLMSGAQMPSCSPRP